MQGSEERKLEDESEKMEEDKGIKICELCLEKKGFFET